MNNNFVFFILAESFTDKRVRFLKALEDVLIGIVCQVIEQQVFDAFIFEWLVLELADTEYMSDPVLLDCLRACRCVLVGHVDSWADLIDVLESASILWLRRFHIIF